MDEVMFGEVFGTVGKFALHMIEDISLAQQVPTKTIDDLIQRLDEITDQLARTTRKVSNIVLIYEGALDLSAAFESISSKFKAIQAGFCVGLADGFLVIYVHKADYKYLPLDLGINDTAGILKNPKIYRFKCIKGPGTNETTMLTLHATMTRAMSNLRVIAPKVGNYSFDQIMDILSKMDMARILLLKGRVVAKPYKQRSEFDLTFMRTYKTFMEIREMQNRQSGMMFNAYKPTMSIVPLDKLINLRSQKGTRLQEVSMRTETYNLTDLFTKPLVSKHGIVILGPTQTTGFGKTQFSLRFLSPLALHRFQEFYS